jgi:mxaJ protein
MQRDGGCSSRLKAFQVRAAAGMLLALMVGSAAAQAPAPAGAAGLDERYDKEKVLRVCQDPNNLPLSNKDGRGFENRIAELLASKLGWKLEHTWYPQRMGFIRNTLRAKLPDSDQYKCDLVTGVSTDFEMGLATKAYYHSTYALAYVKGRGLDDINTPEDLARLPPERRQKLRIGAFAKTPAVDWLLNNGLIDQMVSYQHQTGDPDQYPGQVIERDLASGALDVAIAWGPIVGYFAKKADAAPIAVLPFMPPDKNGVRFDFSIAMAVRQGDKGLRDRINGLIDSSRPEIEALLKEYGVPLLPLEQK